MSGGTRHGIAAMSSHLDAVMKLLTVSIHAGQLLLVWLQVRHLLKKQRPKQQRRKHKKTAGHKG